MVVGQRLQAFVFRRDPSCVIQITPSPVRQVPVLVAQCFPRPRGMKRQEPTSTAQCTVQEVTRIYNLCRDNYAG